MGSIGSVHSTVDVPNTKQNEIHAPVFKGRVRQKISEEIRNSEAPSALLLVALLIIGPEIHVQDHPPFILAAVGIVLMWQTLRRRSQVVYQSG